MIKFKEAWPYLIVYLRLLGSGMIIPLLVSPSLLFERLSGFAVKRQLPQLTDRWLRF